MRASGSQGKLCGHRMGILGTLSRLVVGLWVAGSVALGHASGPFRPLPWLLGLVVLPSVALLLHWSWVRRHSRRLEATGPIAHASQAILFFGMLAIPEYVPALWFTADTALLYYGGAMLLAAARRQLDCEVLALSNWVLRRDDRVGCLIFAAFDHLDRRLDTRGRHEGRALPGRIS